MDYILILLSFSFCIVAMAYLPILSDRLKVSYTVPLLLIGILIYYIGIPVEWPKLYWDHKWVKVVTEFIVIISLIGAGLKIGLRYSIGQWRRPLRLVGISMPLYIFVVFCIGYYTKILDGPSALLLAAVLAPTDPVLASDLQLEKPKERSKKNTGMRYLLTAEAGLNDSLAFPFVYLSILWQQSTSATDIEILDWVLFYVFYKIIIGIAIGCTLGIIYSYTLKKLGTTNHDKILSGFVIIGLAVMSYSLGELCNTYGFISVFCTGLFAQYYNNKKEEDFEMSELHVFSEESEKLFTALFCVLFGGYLMSGILDNISYVFSMIAIAAIFIIRPFSGMLGLLGTSFSSRKKWAISFFGVKGIGSFFYLSFALSKINFNYAVELYATVTITVLISILTHGIFGPKVVTYFKRNEPG